MKKSLRVMMTISGFYPAIGGGEQQCLRLSKALLKNGIDVHVLTYRLSSDWSAQDIVDSVPVTRLRLPKLRIPGVPYLKMCFYLLQHHRDYDLIHSHGVSLHSTASAIAGWVCNKPMISLLYNTGQRADLELVRQKLPQIFFELVKHSVLSNNAVIAICDAIRSDLVYEGMQVERIISIPNGIDREAYIPAHEALKLKRKHEMGLPENTIIVLRVGSLMAKKGIDVLLEAWPSVVAHNNQALLVNVGGNPEDVKELVKTWKNRVLFVSKNDNVLSYLQASDIFVLPSFAEGLSNALIEAQACGLASVVTRVGGNSEIVIHGDNGLVVEPGKADELAAALEILVNNPDIRARMGNRARELSKRYDMSVVVHKYITLYRQLEARKRIIGDK